MVRIAINGFGRIGRLFFRAGFEKLDIVAINDLGNIRTMAHLLANDSVHGKFPCEISLNNGNLVVQGKEIVMCCEKDPEKLPWKDLDIDIVIESTGFFTTKEGASKHLDAGAKKVLISAPAKGDIKTIVKGVNEHTYDKEKDNIISNASCTTNCLAPIIKVLNDNFGVKRGFMTTVHAYTGDQRILDFPHKDLRRARAAAQNIIPTTTGAAVAVGLVVPEVSGKLDGIAMRCPVADGSVVDLVVELNSNTTEENIKNLFKNVAGSELKDVLEYSEEPLVSSDIIGNAHSSVFDATLTKLFNGNFVKIVSWYDNEWGYSNRLVDVAQILL